ASLYCSPWQLAHWSPNTNTRRWWVRSAAWTARSRAAQSRVPGYLFCVRSWKAQKRTRLSGGRGGENGGGWVTGGAATRCVRPAAPFVVPPGPAAPRPGRLDEGLVGLALAVLIARGERSSSAWPGEDGRTAAVSGPRDAPRNVLSEMKPPTAIDPATTSEPAA